jgi:hypothetical protein
MNAPFGERLDYGGGFKPSVRVFKLDPSAAQGLAGINLDALVATAESHVLVGTSGSAQDAGLTEQDLLFSAGLPLKPSPPFSFPITLLRKQQDAIRRAREYRKKHGNPVDNLEHMLARVVRDGKVWRAILDEPYG